MPVTENEVSRNLMYLSGRDMEVAYDFLLAPTYSHKDIEHIREQVSCGETYPDLEIRLKNQTTIRIEVKIRNDAVLTDREKSPYARDLFIIPDNYPYKSEIPVKYKTWGAFFNYCREHGCEMQALNSLKFTLGL